MWLFLMFIRLSLDLECEDGVESVDFYSILAEFYGFGISRKFEETGEAKLNENLSFPDLSHCVIVDRKSVV